MSTKDSLIQKLQDKTAPIGILGMGYVGMPLAVVFAEKGFNVLGIDPDPRKVDTFSKGVSYIQDVPSETVARLKKAGKLNMTAASFIFDSRNALGKAGKESEKVVRL